MDERRLEIKVGALLLAAIAGGLALLYLMGELSFGEGERLQVTFGHTGNVVKGAPVKLAGVPVGRVEAIVLSPDRRDSEGTLLPVLMELSIEARARAALRGDAAVTIATVGPLGEPYLELYVGSEEERYLGKEPIRGTDALRLDLVAKRLSKFLDSASLVLEDDPRALSSLVSGVTGLSKTVDGMLAENREDVRSLTSELTAAAKDLRALSQLARASLPPLSRQAQVAVGGLAALAGGFTDEDGKKLKGAIDRYASAGARLDKLAERGDHILARLEAGEGTAGLVLKDPTLYNDLRDLVSDLRKRPWKLLWKD